MRLRLNVLSHRCQHTVPLPNLKRSVRKLALSFLLFLPSTGADEVDIWIVFVKRDMNEAMTASRCLLSTSDLFYQHAMSLFCLARFLTRRLSRAYNVPRTISINCLPLYKLTVARIYDAFHVSCNNILRSQPISLIIR